MNLVSQDDRSSGTPLVLLHGFCESRAIFEQIRPSLSAFAQVFRPDFPGFGGQAFDPRIRSLDDLAFWLRDFLDAEGLGRVVLVGHSMGGYVAMAFAEHFPERLLGLGLLHSTALPDTPERQANRTKSMAFIEAHGPEAFLKVFVPSLFHNPRPEWLAELFAITAQTDPAAMLALTRIMRDRPDRTHVAANLKLPLLYIVGDHDGLLPPERSREEFMKVELALVHRIKGAGHMAMYETPEAVIAALQSLVRLS